MKVKVIGAVYGGERETTRDAEGKEKIVAVHLKHRQRPSGLMEEVKKGIELDDEQAIRLIDSGNAVPDGETEEKKYQELKERRARQADDDFPFDEPVDDEGGTKNPSTPRRQGVDQRDPSVTEPGVRGGPSVKEVDEARRSR
jgi:hypothetical protein